MERRHTEMRMYRAATSKIASVSRLLFFCFLLIPYTVCNAQESIKLHQIDSLIETKQLSKAAKILSTMDPKEIYSSYGQYNLGTALIADRKLKAGISLLDDLTRRPADNNEQRALKDKTHLVLGQTLLKHKKPFLAQKHFSAIEPYSIFYREALLGAGKTDLALRQYKQALSSWTKLQEMPINSAVLESFYLRPELLFKLGFYDSSLNEYKNAVKQYQKAKTTLETAITELAAQNIVPTENIEATTLFSPYINRHLVPLLASKSFQQGIANINNSSPADRKKYIEALSRQASAILKRQKEQIDKYLAASYLAIAHIYDRKAGRISAAGAVQ